MKRSIAPTRLLLVLGWAASLTACESKRPQPLPKPPAELVVQSTPQPLVPADNTDAAVAGYINALRAWGREGWVRFDALKAWATEPKADPKP